MGQNASAVLVILQYITVIVTTCHHVTHQHCPNTHGPQPSLGKVRLTTLTTDWNDPRCQGRMPYLGNFKQSFPVDVCIHYEVFTESNIRLTAALIEFLPQSDLETMYPRFHRATPKERLCTPWNSINAISLTPATCGYSWISLGWFYMVLLYYVILRVVSNLQFVYFSSLGPPLTLVISGHLWTFAELQQLQRHVQRYQGIN